MLEYILVWGKVVDVAEEINAKITLGGWMIHGSPIGRFDGTEIVQAMVRPIRKDEENGSGS